jgi:hypothetical protein
MSTPVGGADQITVESDNASTSLHSEFLMARKRIEISFSEDTFAASPVVVVYGERPRLLVADLGWSREEAAAVRGQLAAFEEDWDAPGMDAYDAL